MGNQVLRAPIKRFFNLLKLDKKAISYIYVYAILVGLIALSLPLGVQAIIGLIAGGKMSASLIILVAIVTVGNMLSGILRIMQISITENIQRKIFARSALDFTFRIPKLNMENLSTNYPPELMNRFFDTMTIQKGIPKILLDVTTAVLQITFGLVLITFYHSFFAFFGLTLLALLIAIFWFTSAAGLKTSLEESKYKFQVAHWLEDMARTIDAFKFFGKAPISLRKTDKLVCSYLTSRQKHFRVLLTQYGYLIALKTILTGSLLLLGSYLVIQNQINIGQFVAAEIVIIQIINSVDKLIMEMENIYDVLTALEKIGFVVDLPLESDRGLDFKEVDSGSGIAVAVGGLKYKFADAEKNTINGIEFEVKPGNRLNVAGYNGSGKSTLLQLLVGQFPNFTGNISYNGFPLRNLDPIQLREHIGYLNQGNWIFEGSVMDNITLGRDKIELNDVIWAASQVNLMDYIQNLPYGFDTALISEGRNIPGHIRAKIKLARAIVSRPKLLIIESDFQDLERDEYEDIIRFLMSKSNDWTLIFSGNDPFVASHSDEVIILESGKIIERGSFSDMFKSEHFDPIFISGRGAFSDSGSMAFEEEGRSTKG